MSQTITFEATSVTGNQTLPIDVDKELPAETVANSIANIMALPDNVPWALRDDESSAYLDDSKTIGEQVRPGARVTVTPKAHLG